MPNSANSCTDPIVGAILSGWRYDISSISPEMRTDYENHLAECGGCRRRQSKARMLDVMLLLATTLSIAAFLLAAALLRRIELFQDVPAIHRYLHQMPTTLSLWAVVAAGLLVSIVSWILVAVATPVPGFIGSVVVKRLPSDLQQKIARRHA